SFGFGSGLELIGISSIILMLAAFNEKKIIWLIMLSSVFLWFLSIALLIGQRRYIVYLTLMAFIIFNYRVYRMKLIWVLIISLLAYSFFFIYAHTRAIWTELGIYGGIVETFNYVVKHPDLLLPFVGGEFIPPSKAIIEILSDNTFQFKYGSSYLVGLIRIIPRVGRLWPEALQSLAQWRLVTYYPGLIKKGQGFVFFTTAEGFVNFGYPGVFLHMCFYGFVAKSIFLYFRQNSTKTFVLLTYAAIFSLMLFEGIHAEFGQVLWYATHTYLGPLFILIIIIKILNRGTSKK
ncbi:MAG: O-antigen polymerase, partial [Candidatus Hodarchaeota archaeon]